MNNRIKSAFSTALVLLVCCVSVHAAPPITVTSSSVGDVTELGYPDLPDVFGCYDPGDTLYGISPQLSWSGFPAKTKFFAVIVSDPDAPGKTFFHWGMYNIPKTVTSLSENSGQFSEGRTKQTRNDFGGIGYAGPCPPVDSVHRYVFDVYALKSRIRLPRQATAKQLRKALRKDFKSEVVAKGKFTAVYPTDCVAANNCTMEGCSSREKTWSCSIVDGVSTCTCS